MDLWRYNHRHLVDLRRYKQKYMGLQRGNLGNYWKVTRIKWAVNVGQQVGRRQRIVDVQQPVGRRQRTVDIQQPVGRRQRTVDMG